MANAWFRFYSRFEDDPDVQMMSEADQRRLALLFCERCKGEKRTDQQRSFKWRVSLDEVARTKAIFIANGFIDEDWNLLNWQRLQFLSDSSTERVQKFRERRKNKGEKRDETLLKLDETNRETKCNGLEQSRTEHIRTEQRRADASRGKAQDRGELISLSSIFSKLSPLNSTPLPRNRSEMIAGGYVFSNRAACNGCGEEIEWWSSPRGARLPMNLMSEDPSAAIVHLETCRSAAEYRKAN